MSIYAYHWVFKANEIVPALKQRELQIRESLAELDTRVPSDTEDERLEQVQALATKLGVRIASIRSSADPKKTIVAERNNANRKLGQTLRLIKLFSREDPHRQFKVGWDEVNEWNLIPVDTEQEDD